MNHIKNVGNHWRDILVVLTAILMVSSVLLLAYGINQNNKLAAQTKKLAIQNKELADQNTQHINCIIKDLATPIPVNARGKVITNLSTDCDIKFTQ